MKGRTTSILTLFVFLAAGFALALAAAAYVEIRIDARQNAAQAATVENSILALQNFALYLTVESYDATSNSMTAVVYSPAANQFLRQQLKLEQGISVMRRDAVIENGVITGVKETLPATVGDLVPATRGIGLMRYDTDGSLLLMYIEIGEPFSRP